MQNQSTNLQMLFLIISKRTDMLAAFCCEITLLLPYQIQFYIILKTITLFAPLVTNKFSDKLFMNLATLYNPVL